MAPKIEAKEERKVEIIPVAEAAEKPQEPPKAPEVVKTPPAPTKDPRELLRQKVRNRWGAHELNAIEQLTSNESGAIPGRLNKDSFACGIPQSLPCTKLYPEMTNDKIRQIKVVRADGKWVLPNPDVERETTWMVDYIQGNYGTPTAALHFWHCTGWCYKAGARVTVWKDNTWY